MVALGGKHPNEALWNKVVLGANHSAAAKVVLGVDPADAAVLPGLIGVKHYKVAVVRSDVDGQFRVHGLSLHIDKNG